MIKKEPCSQVSYLEEISVFVRCCKKSNWILDRICLTLVVECIEIYTFHNYKNHNVFTWFTVNTYNNKDVSHTAPFEKLVEKKSMLHLR